MKKTTLITGANRGIGLALARLLAARGDAIVALVRRSSPELDALGVRVETGVDMTETQSIAAAAQRLDGTTFDALLLSAGVLSSDALEPLDEASIRRQFEVNALGPLRVVSLFLPKMKNGSKIGLITSRMGSIADNTSGSMYGYRMSKAALNMAGMSLARDLEPRGIPVAIVHPGFVRTDMTGGAGNIDPEEAARGILARMDALTMQSTGTFWHQNGEKLPF